MHITGFHESFRPHSDPASLAPILIEKFIRFDRNHPTHTLTPQTRAVPMAPPSQLRRLGGLRDQLQLQTEQCAADNNAPSLMSKVIKV